MARLIGDAYIVIYPQTDLFGAKAEEGIKKGLAALKPIVTVYPKLDKSSVAAISAEMRAAADKLDVEAVLSPESAAKVKSQLDSLIGKAAVDLAIDPATYAKMQAQMSALHTDFSVGTKIDPASLAAAKAGVQAYLDKNIVAVPVGAQLSPASLASMKASLDAFVKNGIGTANVPVHLNAASLAAAKASLDAFMRGIGTAEVGARINPADLAAMKAAMGAFVRTEEAKPIELSADLNTALADTRLEALRGSALALATQLLNMRANIDDTGVEAKVVALQVKAQALAATLAAVGSGADFAPFEAQLLGITAAYGKIKAAQEDEDNELTKQTGLWGALGLQGPGSLIHITDILNASLPEVELFSGAIGDLYKTMTGNELTGFASHLTSVATSAHLTTEAAVEFAAVWVPATIAMAVFAAAAVPTLKTIGQQLDNMNTAAKGTGQSFKSLATNGESVIAAVKPSVMEAFGLALYAVQNHSSTLDDAMKTLGSDIDQMAAKAAIAFDKGSGTFFTQGATDANLLMISFENLGSILGTLMKAVPGYAEVLLGFGNDILGAAAATVKFAEPVLQVGLALHGAMLYGGLFGTAVAKGFALILPAVTTAIEAIAGWAAANLAADSVVTEGLGRVLLGMDALAAGPVIAGIGLVAGAFAALVIYEKAADNQAKDFNSTLQATIKNATLGTLGTTLAEAYTQAEAKATAAAQQFAQAQKQVGEATVTVQDPLSKLLSSLPVLGSAFTNTTSTYTKAQEASTAYAAVLKQVAAENTNYNANLNEVAKTLGVTTPQALAVLEGAQVTSSEMTTKSASNTAELNVMAKAYVDQLNVMTAGTGTLNQALNALNVTQSAQISDAQKLAQAYSSWIGIVTSGDSAFTSFEQGQKTLATAMAGGSAAGVKLTATAGNLKDQLALVKTNLDGTTDSALAARQAFDSQVTAATSLYGSLQTMAVASGSTATAQVALTKAGKDLVAQLLPMAAGSQEATAEVSALAQIVGGPSTDSFQVLAKWVGTTKGAEADLDSQQTILTLSTANLTQAAKDLSTAVGSEITAAEASAIAQTTGLNTTTLNLAKAMSQSQGAASAAAVTYAGQMYEALIKAGTGSTTAEQDVDAFLKQLGATPAAVATVNKALASLPTQVNVTVNANTSAAVAALDSFNSLVHAIGSESVTIPVGVAAPAKASGGIIGAARGMVVPGTVIGAARGITVPGTSSSVTHDNHLAMVKSGELIVPSQHAPKFRDMARKASIHGFDAGGAVESDPLFGGVSAPYSYTADGGATIGVPVSVQGGSPGMPPMTTYQGQVLIQLLQQQNKLLAQMPYSQAHAINQAQAAGVRRGYFATSG